MHFAVKLENDFVHSLEGKHRPVSENAIRSPYILLLKPSSKKRTDKNYYIQF